MNALKISLAQTPQEGPFQVIFVGLSIPKSKKELNTRDRKGQDAEKITSSPAGSCSNFFGQ